ncbi:histidine triad protein [Lactococcus hodotermopsidis]|uniref:Histidine triad protein n=1 Tax=Pseudolactococcus hodotermopsidis TaxID=2709157 RepID=A0A6A0BD29_9LACT|nr:HIT family protein [Lactococcus hodotermopsidis]GFH43312.1 histidine triad protein [Lactococcus hodotermopsidis]
MTDCIFCKIIAGDIPSYTIYEDDDVLAFLDITQTTKGHTLLIPKKHADNLLEMPADDVSVLFSKVPALAKQLTEKLGATGLNLLQNNTEIAGQSVFHTHIHLIPRYAKNDDFAFNFTEHTLDLKAIQDTITA